MTRVGISNYTYSAQFDFITRNSFDELTLVGLTHLSMKHKNLHNYKIIKSVSISK